MNALPEYRSLGRTIWVSLFGRWMFALLVPWFVPTISYLLIGPPYLESFRNFALGTLMIFGMTVFAFIPHDWAARYFARRYPSLDATLRRAWYTALAFWALTFVYVTAYAFFIIRFKPVHAQLDAGKMVNVYLFEFFAVILLTALYEINYSLNKWRSISLNKEAMKKAGMQGQLQSLKSQVNPHFLFNSLNTLSALITDEPKRAEQFVDEMAKVYRYLLQTNQNELTTVATEIRFIRSYFHLLRTRHDTGVALTVDIADTDMERHIPPLTLQLLLENAVKHNAILEQNPLHVTIRSVGDGMLEVRNNVLEKSTPVKSTRLGLANIMAKYKILSERMPVVASDSQSFTVMLPFIDVKTENQ